VTFFIGTSSVQGSHYHAGILFLNGAGFWVRVTYTSTLTWCLWNLQQAKHLTSCIDHSMMSFLNDHL
jgi:hypothetical protein